MEEILVDEEGYSQFFEELEKVKQSLQNNATIGSIAIKDAIGDGWHDNFAFEESRRVEASIAAKITSMQKEKNRLKKVNTRKEKDNIINIGDIITLRVKYSEEDIEEYKIKLTGKYLPNSDAEIQEISLNSPIGKAIYLRDISDNIFYEVNNKKVEITILEKTNPK